MEIKDKNGNIVELKKVQRGDPVGIPGEYAIFSAGEAERVIRHNISPTEIVENYTMLSGSGITFALLENSKR